MAQVRKPDYTLDGVKSVVEEACAALNSGGRAWTVSVSPANGPVFGTPGMPRVSLIDEDGRVGPEVFVEDDHTLWLVFEDAEIHREWWGGPRYDGTLRDVLYSLAARTFTPGRSWFNKDVVRIFPPDGRKPFTFSR